MPTDMSEDSPDSVVLLSLSSRCMKWETQLRAYLTGASDHVRVIQVRRSGSAFKSGALESAHAAPGRNCHLCRAPGYFAPGCPHWSRSPASSPGATAMATVIGMEERRGKGRSNGHGGNTRASAASTSSTGNTSLTINDNANTDQPASQETAVVASLSRFFLDSHVADVWLRDSGASSPMSTARPAAPMDLQRSIEVLIWRRWSTQCAGG
jgi:hypothetical protein